MTVFFDKSIIPAENWESWTWQVKNIIKHNGFKISPYTASQIDWKTKNNPLTAMYQTESLPPKLKKGESLDPLDELEYMKTPHIVHKYKDRVLFLVSNICASYCGYCTRARLANSSISTDYEESFAYLAKHPEIKQVIVSGGDPLLLSDNKIESILINLRKIKSLEVIRIASKLPVTLPMRFTDNLIEIIKQARPVILSIHICHPIEVSPEFESLCDRLNQAGIMLNSQSVMLKGVNDSVKVLKELYQKLIKNYVIPYAIYSCDPVKNGEQYRVPLNKGAKLIAKLKEEVSGTIIPTYFADIPYAKSKITITHNNISKTKQKFATIKNERGKKFKYLNK